MQEAIVHRIFIDVEGEVHPRLKYTLDFIETHPFFQDSHFFFDSSEQCDHSIYYSSTKERTHTWIRRQKVLFNRDNINGSFHASAYSYKDSLYYAVEEEKSKGKLALGTIPFDLFESIFFHISRYEEWFCKKEDHNEWDALREDRHFLIANNQHRQPVVDHLVHLLRHILQFPIAPLETKIVLTHDIDYLKKFSGKIQIFRKIAGHLRRRERLAHLPRLIKDYFQTTWKGQADPYQNLPWLLGHGFPGEKYLFLIVGGKHQFDPPHKSDNVLHEAVKLALASGYNVGLHPSYSTDRDQHLLSKEYQRLSQVADQTIIYSRQHYLHFDFRSTPQNLIDVGIKHDFTMGYNRHVGFRCGTAFPYTYYSFEKEGALDLLCHPLAFMDSSCFHEAGQDGVKFQKIFNAFFTANNACGVLNVNFHNQFFDTASYYDIPLADMYKKLLSDFS